MRNILIYGCTGQDGSLLTKSLLSQGYDVIGVSRSSKPNLATHTALGIANEIEVVTADLCDFRETLEIFEKYQPVEVYNLAAQSSVGLSFRQPVDTFNSIINGTINLLEVSRYLSYTGRLYFAGSSEIFGNTHKPAQITSSRQPLSPYAIAKDASFNTVKIYREAYKLNCVTGVLFNHESPFRSPTFVTRKIILGAIRCFQNPSYKLSLGNLSVCRDWGWAEEYVEAMQLIIRADHLDDQVICTGISRSLEYFVDQVFHQLNLNWKDYVEIQETLLRPSEIFSSCGDPQPMIKAHNWSANTQIDSVIEKLLSYELSNQQPYKIDL